MLGYYRAENPGVLEAPRRRLARHRRHRHASTRRASSPSRAAPSASPRSAARWCRWRPWRRWPPSSGPPLTLDRRGAARRAQGRAARADDHRRTRLRASSSCATPGQGRARADGAGRDHAGRPPAAARLRQARLRRRRWRWPRRRREPAAVESPPANRRAKFWVRAICAGAHLRDDSPLLRCRSTRGATCDGLAHDGLVADVIGEQQHQPRVERRALGLAQVAVGLDEAAVERIEIT